MSARLPRRGGTPAVLLALLLSLLLAGCGGGGQSTVSARTYAGSLCEAIRPFEHDIATGATALDPARIDNTTQARRALHGFLQTLADDTRSAAAKLRSDGRPRISRGATVAKDFVTLFTRLDAALQRAADRAAKLPTQSTGAFRTAADQLGSSVRASLSNLGQSLARSPALQAAAKKAPACRSLS